ncbi:sugar phosphate isomerase/epimerase [Roseimicrobium gellanilyticum]|uniref:Sugar phosphate isomerase/epimerase n=1 Tax=Roseimicrobium gellanilyticum TaxID=748857 RepID=A0A366H5V8_9BACT|nr:TIM barrel protein [Roseimicrobium gellanilyticum]RBP36603.1 sugar phosphate isomerase/epimerase [Roseimicrobium gellanilyticum]
MNTSRRHFLKSASLASAASALAPVLSSSSAMAAAAGGKAAQEYCFFTKHLQGLSYAEIADIAASLDGMTGIEAPIRPKGQVEPERVEEDLPKYVEELKKRKLGLTIMTSGINEVSKEQNTEKVLRTAKALGVPHYRMNYNKYDLSKPIWPQLQEWKAKFKDLIALSSEIGIQPLYQNHSGKDYLGAPVWDVFTLMQDYPAKDWAFAFDFFHATVEGSLSWPLELNLVRDRIGAVYFKNFKWGEKRAEGCPLGEGVVGKEHVAMLKKIGFTGPISLHVEYLKGNMEQPGYKEEAIAATKRDFAVLREWWG